MTTYELKLTSGAVVLWDGDTPERAARAYVAGHAGASVVAWRLPELPLVVGLPRHARFVEAGR